MAAQTATARSVTKTVGDLGAAGERQAPSAASALQPNIPRDRPLPVMPINVADGLVDLSAAASVALPPTAPFRISADSVIPLTSPTQYYETIMRLIKCSNSRISMQFFYSTVNRREQEVFRALAQRARDTVRQNGQQVDIRLAVDFLRTLAPDETDPEDVGHDKTRMYDSSSKLVLELLTQAPDQERTKVGLLLLPQSRFRSRRGFLPVPLKHSFHPLQVEAISHLKLLVFDDNVIITGANLSRAYFTNRQDRYLLLAGVPEFAAWCHGLIRDLTDLPGGFMLRRTGHVTANGAPEPGIGAAKRDGAAIPTGHCGCSCTKKQPVLPEAEEAPERYAGKDSAHKGAGTTSAVGTQPGAPAPLAGAGMGVDASSGCERDLGPVVLNSKLLPSVEMPPPLPQEAHERFAASLRQLLLRYSHHYGGSCGHESRHDNRTETSGQCGGGSGDKEARANAGKASTSSSCSEQPGQPSASDLGLGEYGAFRDTPPPADCALLFPHLQMGTVQICHHIDSIASLMRSFGPCFDAAVARPEDGLEPGAASAASFGRGTGAALEASGARESDASDTSLASAAAPSSTSGSGGAHTLGAGPAQPKQSSVASAGAGGGMRKPCTYRDLVHIGTGYLNFPQGLTNVLLHEADPSASVHILTASPDAMDFAEGPASGAVKVSYSEIERRLFRGVTQANRVHVHPQPSPAAAFSPGIALYEYGRPTWTFHGKGLWVERRYPVSATDTTTATSGSGVSGSGGPSTATLPPVAFITSAGSSNFGRRSQDRDLEMQIEIASSNEALVHRLRIERDALFARDGTTHKRYEAEMRRWIPASAVSLAYGDGESADEGASSAKSAAGGAGGGGHDDSASPSDTFVRAVGPRVPGSSGPVWEEKGRKPTLFSVGHGLWVRAASKQLSRYL